MTVTERTRKAIADTDWMDAAPWVDDRDNHSHNLSGTVPVWVECDTLSHCPSWCTCPVDACSASVI
jgi:hypothetical protein